MARRLKKGQQEVIAPQDAREAHKRNVDTLIAALASASANQFSTFLEANADTLGDLFARAAPILNSAQTLPHEKIHREVLKAVKDATPEEMQTLNLRDTLGIKKLVSDADVAKEAAEREMYHNRSRENFRSAYSNLRNGVTSLATGTVSVIGIPKALAQVSILPTWQIMAGTLDAFRVPRWQRAANAAVLFGGLAAVGSIDGVDSAPYAKEMTTADSFHAACLATPEMMNGNTPINAVYAVEFDKAAQTERERMAQIVMNHGARHGVPAIALHMMSNIETARFTDVVSRSADEKKTQGYTAEGYFQVIDSTKLTYMKAYGQDTFIYQEAKDRLNAGSGTLDDSLLVEAVDTVSSMSGESIKSALKNQKMDAPTFHAMTLAAEPLMQAELVALNMKHIMPEITNPALGPDEILAITERHYARDHFLGIGNYKRLEGMAETAPDEPIGERFPGIVTANPGLLETDMTAGEALHNIEAKFSNFNQDPFQAFKAMYNQQASVTDICLTDEAKSLIPDKISYIEAALHETGAYPWWEATMDKAQTTWYHLTAAADTAQGMAKKFGLVSEPATTVDAPPARVAQAPSPHALQTSLRPEPRPERLRVAALEQK